MSNGQQEEGQNKLSDERKTATKNRNDHLLNSTLLFCAAIVLSPDAFEQYYYYCFLWAATQPTISHPRETMFCCLRWAVSSARCVCASWRCTAIANTLHGIYLFFLLHLKKLKKPAVNILSEVNKSQYLLFSSLISRQRCLQLSVKLSIRWLRECFFCS